LTLLLRHIFYFYSERVPTVGITRYEDLLYFAYYNFVHILPTLHLHTQPPTLLLHPPTLLLHPSTCHYNFVYLFPTLQQYYFQFPFMPCHYNFDLSLPFQIYNSLLPFPTIFHLHSYFILQLATTISSTFFLHYRSTIFNFFSCHAIIISSSSCILVVATIASTYSCSSTFYYNFYLPFPISNSLLSFPAIFHLLSYFILQLATTISSTFLLHYRSTIFNSFSCHAIIVSSFSCYYLVATIASTYSFSSTFHYTFYLPFPISNSLLSFPAIFLLYLHKCTAFLELTYIRTQYYPTIRTFVY
jgi:hypothetical protein